MAYPASADRLVHLGAITEAALAHLELDDLLEALLDRLTEILDADTAAVLLLDHDAGELVARAAKGIEEEVKQGVRIPLGKGFAGRIAAERRPVALARVDRTTVVNPILIERGLRALLGVPLLVEGAVLGVLHVGSLEPREFTDDDADLLQVAADRMALAIDHARLYAAEREARTTAERRAEELMQLQAITDVALGRQSLDDDVLEGMLERIREVLGVDTAAILLLSPEGDELVARAARGIEEEVERGVRIPVGRGFAGRIAAERGAVILDDVEKADIVNPLLREKGIRTLLGVPLIAADRVIGVLHVGSFDGRRFTPNEVDLLERAADRIAIALDRARQHTVAQLLQSTLLPAGLPEVPGLELAARYLPGSDETRVGGDWYDVVRLSGGRVGVAIGDVVSRGVRAAAAMGQMRTALRAYALEGAGPAAVLDRLDRLVRGLDEREMATVAYVVLDPGSGELAFALAGHLAPLVVAPDGTTRFLEGGRSRPIGVATTRRYAQATATLERGETLVLYTDGLVERRGQALDDGLRALAEAARAAAGVHPEELCDRLLHLADGDVVADDVAVLALRAPAADRDGLDLRLPAEADSLAAMRRAVSGWLANAAVEETTGYDVLVAIGEAAANAVEHAYGPSEAHFRVQGRIEDGVLEVSVRDDGRWRPPRGSHRGRGLTMMNLLMDEVKVDSDAGGTVVTMRKRLEGPG